MRRLCFAVILSALTAACSKAPPAPQPPIEVSAELLGEECRLRAEGRAMTTDELIAAARKWHGRSVHLDVVGNTPYKCIGAAIFALQHAGVTGIGFIAEPPPAAEEN